MVFSIFDSGNLVVSYDDEDEAMKALAELAKDPEAESKLLLMAFDATGDVVTTAIPGERLVIPA